MENQVIYINLLLNLNGKLMFYFKMTFYQNKKELRQGNELNINSIITRKINR